MKSKLVTNNYGEKIVDPSDFKGIIHSKLWGFYGLELEISTKIIV